MASTSFSEHDIRPADVLAEKRRLYEAEVARLAGWSGEFVEIPCPACGGESATTKFTMYECFRFRECERCNTLYVSPRPPPDALKRYYTDNKHYEFWNSTIFPKSEDVRRARIFRPRVERVLSLCRKHGVKTDVLLEVGAGFGTFCDELRSTRTFKRIIAVEPTAALAQSCRGRGLEVLEQRVEDVVVEGRVDVVASFEVIEHLFDPGTLVARCAELLSPGGLVVMTCPNYHGFDIQLMGTNSPAVEPEHLNYFHPASLASLFERHGLRVLETSTPGRLDADIVRNRVLDGSFQLVDPFLRRVLIDEWVRLGEPFQNFLADNGLSSNMWVVATKG